MDLRKIPIKNIKFISEKREKLFNKLGVFSLMDMLEFFPRAYENRTEIKRICELSPGETVSVKARVLNLTSRVIRSKLTIYTATVTDGSGTLRLVFFNRKYDAEKLKPDSEFLFYGEVSTEYGSFIMKSPQIQSDRGISFTDSYLPVYNLTKGLTQNIIRTAMKSALLYAKDNVFDNLSVPMRKKYNLCEKFYALSNIHFPKDEDAKQSAIKRIVFEELFYVVLGLGIIREKRNDGVSPILRQFSAAEELAKTFPFELTNAQKNVVREVCLDFKENKRVNRLIQGDVGSGKTAVSAMIMMIALKNGYQTALMAPTEILARQHYNELTKYFNEFGFKTELLVSGISAKEKKRIYSEIENGETDILIGTNAMIFEKVNFKKLGLCITDEQHRFGVKQRMGLAEKGENPHVVVMTATPIPRTLALIIYGDMDVSVIDEMPKGRIPISTKIAVGENKEKVYHFIKERLKEGEQAFVVCPLIEESKALDLENAVKLHEKLQSGILKDYKVGLLHGKMKADEKDEIMLKFKNREIDVLVSTTVIEVGINIPNATVMVIEDANRFGLATLHQLRGRVGRGDKKSYCFLNVSDMTSFKRLKIMEETTNGFKISEFDLKNRGPGEFFGTRQHGLPNLKISGLSYDMSIVKIAKDASDELLKDDPYLLKEENSEIKKQVSRMHTTI